MAKSDFSFVLEDDLLEEYFKFTKPDKFPNEKYDKEIIKSLLSYQIMPFLFSTGQINRLKGNISRRIPNIELIDRNIENQLSKNKLTSGDLIELAKKTFYRCVLSKDKDQYPYVKIGGSDKVVTSVTGSYYYNEPRQKAIEHIRTLCADAKEIIVWDEYIMQEWDKFIKPVLENIIPRNPNIEIVIHDNTIRSQNSISYDPNNVEKWLTEIYSWKIKRRALKVNQHHDRYLVIDNKQDVVLTSGLRYLEDNKKELTYIIKPYLGHL